MIRVYFRNKDKSLGRIDVESNCHKEAIKAVTEELTESPEIFIKPVLAVINKTKQERDYEKQLA